MCAIGMCVLSAVTLGARPEHPAASRPAAQTAATKKAAAPRSVAPATPAESVFVVFDRLATAASTGGAREVQAFVNDYMLRSVAYGVGPSVSARITAAEMAYKTHKGRPITLETVVRAINRTADGYGAPPFMRTNLAQLQYFTELMKRRIPHLAELACDHDTSDNKLSPSQAMFVVTELITQKMMTGSYQVEPDMWVRRTKARIKTAELFPTLARMHQDPVVWGPPLPLRAVMDEAPSDSNIITRIVHTLVDDLGIPRR
jgi:hypothetical protein